MDSEHFDRITRAVAQHTTRRMVVGVAAALGLGPLLTEARKKKNKCKGGCGDCKVCKKKKKTKKCVPVTDGSACPTGTCQAGVCQPCEGCTECQTCQNGACANKTNGTACTNGVCTDGVCGCGDACCGTTYCPTDGDPSDGDLACLTNETCAELCYPTSCPKGCGCTLAVGDPKCFDKSFQPQSCDDIPACNGDGDCVQGRFCAVLPTETATICGYANACTPVCPTF